MYSRPLSILLLMVLAESVTPLSAQFALYGKTIQVHGFASQGFTESDNNNYLTMNTSRGAFDFSDAGISATAQITDHLRIGAQLYTRNIGTLGQWRPGVDWAVVDYQAHPLFGFRAGKVKTVYGLYSDSQDVESLHPWALLPQSVYPLDLRSSTIAHLGGDVYGELPMGKHSGAIAYTAYAGRRFDEKFGGYRNVAAQLGTKVDRLTGWMAGSDLRWHNLVPGLTVGGSWLKTPFEGEGTVMASHLPASFRSNGKSYAFYCDYQWSNIHLTGEVNREAGDTTVTGTPGPSVIKQHSLGWYASISYRVSRFLEIGSYHSRFISDTGSSWNDPSNHIFDQVITARIDVTRHWDFKIEGHLMDGYGSVYSARGFYLLQNPDGFDRKTNMLVLRTGYTF
jgi:hypothetical protein